MPVEKRLRRSKGNSFLVSALRFIGFDPDVPPATSPEINAVKSKSSVSVGGRYMHTLPDDVAPIREFLLEYSGISGEDVDRHLYRMRDRLWDVYPYACVGHFRFASLNFATDVYYQAALSRLRRDPTESGGDLRLLDVGCCVGQLLRKLAFDGVDSSRLFGIDIEPRFLEMGYDMFSDRDKFKGTFLVGDPLAPADDGKLNVLDGNITFIHAGSFFHLFTWNDQVRVATRMIRFLDANQPDVMVFGRHVGTMLPRDNVRSDKVYLHNADSWQKLWDEVGERSGTKWKATMMPTGTIDGAGGVESSLRKMTFCVTRS